MHKSKRLSHNTEVKVRFSEVDQMGIVWHGNYVKYIEEGREAFGKENNISYMQIYDHGYMVPIVKLDVDYVLPAKYGDILVVETSFVNTIAAKILYEFNIYRKEDNAKIARAKSMQVFLDKKNQLVLNPPDFFVKWKEKMGLQ